MSDSVSHTVFQSNDCSGSQAMGMNRPIMIPFNLQRKLLVLKDIDFKRLHS